jgi:DNA-binding beta-propeller fold protein YncE
VWDSKLYVGEYYNHRISVFDLNTYMPIFLLGREGTGQTEFRRVTGVAVDPNTQLLYVGDSFNHRVSVFSAVDGSWFGSIGHEGKGKGEFHHVRDIAVDADAGLLYVSDWGNNRIQVFGVFQRPRIPRSADDDDQDI